MSCQGNLDSLCIVGYESGHVGIFDSRTRNMLEEVSVFQEPST